MNRNDAQKIVRLREVAQELSLYADIRTEELKNELLITPIENTLSLQARYAEVRRLKTLGDEIIKALKETT